MSKDPTANMLAVSLNGHLGLEVHPGVYAFESGLAKSIEALAKFGVEVEPAPEGARPRVSNETILAARAIYKNFVERGWR